MKTGFSGLGAGVNAGHKKSSPTKTWIHSDDKMLDGVVYNVKYVGRIGINESMKSLNFETRTQVARESIRRVAECAKLLVIPRRNKKQNEEQINQILNITCNTDYTGLNVALLINVQFLKVNHLETNDKFFQHTMQNISFACGGDTDIQDFIAYVAKDDVHGRACYVFECTGGLANNVITTIGHAFELRFKNFLNSNMQSLNNANINNIIRNPISPSKSSTNNASNLKSNHEFLKSPDHFENSVNGSIASSSIMIKTPSTHSNNKNEIPITKFSLGSEQVQVLSNYTNSNHDKTVKPIQTGTNFTAKKIEDKLDKMKWFHGLMTRDNAEKLLVNNGDYLVRETNKAERQYVLSGRYKDECRHIFLVDPSGIVRTKDRVFENICHLIQYHQDNNIPIISKDNELLLEHPVCKTG